MTLYTESWGNPDLPTLFCIHGWASNRNVFKPLAELFKDHFHFVVVDLPGYGESPWSGDEAAYEPHRLVDALLDVAPAKSVWVGWSLGGMLATLAASKAPARVEKLITLSTNAKFLADKQWKSGVPLPLFNGFMDSIEDVRTTLRRFAALCVVGEQSDMLVHLKWLQQETQVPAPNSEVLRLSLECLRSIDNREALVRLPVSCCHLLATDDAVVPHTVSQALQGLNPKHITSFTPNASHACLVTQPQSVANGMLAFLQGSQ